MKKKTHFPLFTATKYSLFVFELYGPVNEEVIASRQFHKQTVSEQTFRGHITGPMNPLFRQNNLRIKVIREKYSYQ